MKKKHAEILRSIYDSVPQELKDSLMVKRETYQDTKELMNLAIADEDFPSEKKEVYKNLMNAGYLDEVEEVMSKDVAQKIDDYIDNLVIKQVEEGNLPKIAKIEIMKKWRKHERELKNK